MDFLDKETRAHHGYDGHNRVGVFLNEYPLRFQDHLNILCFFGFLQKFNLSGNSPSVKAGMRANPEMNFQDKQRLKLKDKSSPLGVNPGISGKINESAPPEIGRAHV